MIFPFIYPPSFYVRFYLPVYFFAVVPIDMCKAGREGEGAWLMLCHAEWLLKLGRRDLPTTAHHLPP